jgi:hypothetical protein
MAHNAWMEYPKTHGNDKKEKSASGGIVVRSCKNCLEKMDENGILFCPYGLEKEESPKFTDKDFEQMAHYCQDYQHQDAPLSKRKIGEIIMNSPIFNILYDLVWNRLHTDQQWKSAAHTAPEELVEKAIIRLQTMRKLYHPIKEEKEV